MLVRAPGSRRRDGEGNRRRPRLLVLNQYFWPGNEATARLLTDLCSALASDFDVTDVTGLLQPRRKGPGSTLANGVEDHLGSHPPPSNAAWLSLRWARTT